MKRLWGVLAILMFCSVLGHGVTRADEPSGIKVGILLPLTGVSAGDKIPQ